MTDVITYKDRTFTQDDFRAILEKEREYAKNPDGEILPDYSCQLLLKMAITSPEVNCKVTYPISSIENDLNEKDYWNFICAWVRCGRYISGDFLNDLIDSMLNNKEIFDWCWKTLKENAHRGILDDISILTD